MKTLNLEDLKDRDGDIRIGCLENYYGGLYARENEGRYFFGICDYDGLDNFQEIPKYLFDALIKFEVNERGIVES